MTSQVAFQPDKARIKKMQDFVSDCGYKDYVENAIAFNRKLNEERKMRLPYIDGQTGVAQRHYDNQRHIRQRMPPTQIGQVLAYPQKHWRKKKYQYLKYLQPKPGILVNNLIPPVGATKFGLPSAVTAGVTLPDPVNNGPVEVNGVPPVPPGAEPVQVNEDSNLSFKEDSNKEWPYFEEDLFQEEEEPKDHSDSDDDFEDYGSKKKKAKAKAGGKTKGSSKSSTPSKRRTHADSIPDSEKPFACEVCGIRYKTRPGLSYHYKNSHKDRDLTLPPASGNVPISSNNSYNSNSNNSSGGSVTPVTQHRSAPYMGADDNATPYYGRDDSGGYPHPHYPPPPPHPHQMPRRVMMMGGGSHSGLTPPATPGMMSHESSMDGSRSSSYPMPPHGSRPPYPPHPGNMYGSNSSPAPNVTIPPPPQHNHPSSHPMPPTTSSSSSSAADGLNAGITKTMSGKPRATPSGYCDFCLGDASQNKKSGQSEVLVSCAECGRAGHPTCLQFSDNMILSIREYPWQCIECKCCTLCGTSENDAKLLFCDDCDRGYHMYCLSPPIKDPPEGSWSCKLCLARFHGKAS